MNLNLIDYNGVLKQQYVPYVILRKLTFREHTDSTCDKNEFHNIPGTY